MIDHIVKNNEGINDILEAYHISLNELKEYNKHITDFNNLVCGIIIKIPYLKDEIEQILDNTEVFSSNYYEEEVLFDRTDEKEDIVEDISIEENEEFVKEQSIEVTKQVKEDVEVIKVRNVESSPRLRPYPGILPPKRPYGGINNKKN